MAQAWITQAGFPLVVFGPATGTGPVTIKVRQERFFADVKVPPARRRARWPVPLVVRSDHAGETRVERFLVDKASDTITLPATAPCAWYFGNAEAGGFYRVLHDPANRAVLVGQLRGALSAVERLALAGDQWALVRAGRATIELWRGDAVRGLWFGGAISTSQLFSIAAVLAGATLLIRDRLRTPRPA